MENPIALEPFVFLGTTNAAANTSKVDAILGAPGGGRRYRVWTVSIGLIQSAAAATALNGFLRSAGVATRLAFVGLEKGPPFITIPGGIRFPTNDGVSIETFCSAAAVSYRCGITYTIEEI